MARRRLQTYDEYRFGKRGVLRPGDRFRVTGGPVYITDDGTKIPMRERGTFVFQRYCEQGSSKWIEAQRGDGGGFVILWVGKSNRSPVIPNLRRRAYRITRKLRASRESPTNGRRKARKRGGNHENPP